RLTSVMMPSLSTPTTPAVTPDNTASMKRRRSSSAVLAPTNSSRWLFSSEVMVLKVEPSTARSPPAGVDANPPPPIPWGNFLRRAHQLADRRHQAVRKPHTDPDGRKQQRKRNRHIHQAKRDLHAGAPLLEQLILGDAGPRGAELLQHACVHGADDIKVGGGEVVQALDGADHVGLAGRNNDHLPALSYVHRFLRRRAIGKLRE